MYLESLLKLAEILDHYDKTGEKLISEKFHEETEKLVVSQTNFLITELEFRRDNPGPYNFGFGELVITLFTPEETGEQEWAAIARKGKWQKSYRYNSVMGLVKVLSLCIQESSDQKGDSKEEKNKNEQAT
jgi:hypothetical protein